MIICVFALVSALPLAQKVSDIFMIRDQIYRDCCRKLSPTATPSSAGVSRSVRLSCTGSWARSGERSQWTSPLPSSSSQSRTRGRRKGNRKTRENRRCRVKTDDLKYNIFILYFVFKAKNTTLLLYLFIVLDLYASSCKTEY